MSVSVTCHDAANTATVLGSSDVTSGGFTHGLLDAAVADPLNRDVSVSIELHRGHPSVSAFSAGRVVRVLDGSTEVTKFEIETVDDRVVADDAAGETVRISGRTLLGQWRKAKLRPHPGVTSDRVAYNFAYPGLDTTTWTDSVSEVDRTSFGFTRPIGWADPYTLGVWTATHSVGSIFGRRQFTVASPGKYVCYASGDDGVAVHLDGVRQFEVWAKPTDLEPVYWRPYRAFLLDLAAGTHTLAIEGRNFSGVGTLWAAIWPTTGTHLGPGDPIVLTGPSSNTAEPYGVWKWRAYPPTRPAPHCTRAIHDFVARAQADSAMAGWSLGFANNQDSDGATPPQIEWSSELTKSGFDMLESFANAGWLTFRVRPGDGKILDCYTTFGTHTGLTHDVDDQLSQRKLTMI